MGILVCAATLAEAKACRAGIRDAKQSKRFEVLQTGVGLELATRALEQRLRRGEKPSLIISTGFAGTLSHDIDMHSWITAVHVAHAHEPDDMHVVECAPISEAVRCTMLTSEKLELHVSSGSLRQKKSSYPVAIDMESAALAELAARHEITFMVLRLVTDTPSKPLPKFLANLTAAMAATDTRTKIKMSLTGVSAALSDPRGVARLVKSGQQWTKLLRSGWKKHASTLG